MLPKEIDVQSDQCDQETRKNPGMQGEETGERIVTRFVATNHELLDLIPNQGRVTHDVGRHLSRPVALLIPRQQVAGQPEPHRDPEQGQPEPEVELARRFVGPIDHHLHEVQNQENNHELRGPMVNSAQPITARNLLLNMIHTLPG